MCMCEMINNKIDNNKEDMTIFVTTELFYREKLVGTILVTVHPEYEAEGVTVHCLASSSTVSPH